MAADLIQAALLFRRQPERNFPVPQGEATIGYDASNEVRVPFEGVSRRHARITFDGKDFWIEDAGSANGTFLNGFRLTRKERLRHLDIVTLGRRTDLIFVRKIMEASRVKRRGIEAAYIETLDGPETGRRDEIPKGSITIGRAPSNNIVAESQLISKIHARLERSGVQLVLIDLQSANGTYVEGKRVTSHVLRDGEVFNLGHGRSYRVRLNEGDVFTHDVAMAPGRDATVAELPIDWKTRMEWTPEEKAVFDEVVKARKSRTFAQLPAQPTRVAPPKSGPVKPSPGKPAEPKRAEPAAAPKPAAPPTAPKPAEPPAASKPAAPPVAPKPVPPPVVPTAAAPPAPAAISKPAPMPATPAPSLPDAAKQTEHPPARPAAQQPPVASAPAVEQKPAPVSPTPSAPAAPTAPPAAPPAAKPSGAPAVPPAPPPSPAPPAAKAPTPARAPTPAGKPPVSAAVSPAARPQPPSPAGAGVSAAEEQLTRPLEAKPVGIRGVVLEGADMRFSLPPGDHEIGRMPGMSVQIEGPGISRHHAMLRVTGQEVTLEDLGSKNGTYVNSQRIVGARRLITGDRLSVGEIQLTVRLEPVGGEPR